MKTKNLLSPKLSLDIRKFIIEWNNRYPFDRVIRKQYGIIFGSEQHKQINFIDMVIEYAEKQVLDTAETNRMRNELEEETRSFFANTLPNDVLQAQGIKPENQERKPIKMSRKEVDKEFENLDLSQFNDEPVKE